MAGLKQLTVVDWYLDQITLESAEVIEAERAVVNQVIRRLVHTDNTLYYVDATPGPDISDAEAETLLLALSPDYVFRQ